MGIENDSSWFWEGRPLPTTKENSSSISDPCENRLMGAAAIAENDFEGKRILSIQFDEYKYIYTEATASDEATEEFFDLQTDELELKDLNSSDGNICDTPITQSKKNLAAEMIKRIEASRKNAATSEGTELNEATVDRMKALGYVD